MQIAVSNPLLSDDDLIGCDISRNGSEKIRIDFSNSRHIIASFVTV